MFCCRGFGFVTFADGEAVVRALDAHSECPIAIDDKIVRDAAGTCIIY